ncbi:glycoside hydrolase family 31 protein [Paxillus involutus ATCC 200175]|uniref:Glycoside hydrolase family 31 protein n=1 Tax=Paxillus involutus ATCC 200175 TaxID=664439 RepID=A0A0C9SSC2_PAXIN|nr:glycoside hydrolase family 31 protein [Paxillus involutus ATCC 200175]
MFLQIPDPEVSSFEYRMIGGIPEFYFFSRHTQRTLSHSERNDRIKNLNGSLYIDEVRPGYSLGDNYSHMYLIIQGILQIQIYQISMGAADTCDLRDNTEEAPCNHLMQLPALTPFHRNHNTYYGPIPQNHTAGPASRFGMPRVWQALSFHVSRKDPGDPGWDASMDVANLIQYYILAVLAPYVTFFTPHDPRDLIHAAMMRDKLFGFCTANVCWRSLHDAEPVVVVVGDGEPDVDPEVEEDPELEVEPELEVLETNEATGGPGKMY